MSKTNYEDFDINGVGLDNGNIFGLPHTAEQAAVVILPIPWDVTTSYSAGTSNGPAAILKASPQLDLFDKDHPDAWKRGVYMFPIDEDLEEKNKSLRPLAEAHIAILEKGHQPDNGTLKSVVEINKACKALKDYICNYTHSLLLAGKKVGVLGGDHSTPLALIEALALLNDSFGVLQIDAHMDLRKSYEGFEYSHASIMYNALKSAQVSKLVQVGIRDYCEEEYTMMKNSGERIITFFDSDLKQKTFQGISWEKQCEQIISHLPDKVYISYDIDGLLPYYCPNTGTPVPGGLDYDQVHYLINKVISSGREIIGFDLCEVAPSKNNDWNENVGARVLWDLCKSILACK